MDVRTHKLADGELVGRVVEAGDGYARVVLKTTDSMAVDEHGLVHGGFTFGAADLAAMVAVNHPNVVLYKAEVRFTAPVRVGEEVTAEATVTTVENKKITVGVRAFTDKTVLEGVMYCYIPDRHVLEK
ncbi:thioesterase, FlK family [Geoglobus acetivorans]|uniref:PaaI family thioesterase n=1 Tax=Geoglobus acetivorans TaxID=565033 RepID=A0ABZ3H5L7_GEOAI|nr:PaaI family thioesterase [Geoglobus acetivorans]